MTVCDYDENIVHYYNNYLLNYLDSTVNINGSHKNNIIIQGFQTLLHVLTNKTDDCDFRVLLCRILF